MKDKEKQIEELAKEICGACLSIEEPCYMKEQPCCITKKQAKRVYNAGYRKIDKDSVVLSREEYAELQKNDDKQNKELRALRRQVEYWKERAGMWKQASYDIRKETAEKFVNLLTDNGERQTLNIEDDSDICDEAYIIPQSHLRQVAKQLGFEIKE